MPYYIKNIRKPSGKVYPHWYEQWWNPLRKKPQSRHVGRVGTSYDFARFVLGPIGLAVMAWQGKLPTHDYKFLTDTKMKWEHRAHEKLRAVSDTRRY